MGFAFGDGLRRSTRRSAGHTYSQAGYIYIQSIPPELNHKKKRPTATRRPHNTWPTMRRCGESAFKSTAHVHLRNEREITSRFQDGSGTAR